MCCTVWIRIKKKTVNLHMGVLFKNEGPLHLDTPKAPIPRNNAAASTCARPKSATIGRPHRNAGSGMCLVKTCNCRTQLTSRKNNGRRKTLFLNVSCDASFVFVELCIKRFVGAVPALDSVTDRKSDKQKLKSTGRKANGMPPKASVLH